MTVQKLIFPPGLSEKKWRSLNLIASKHMNIHYREMIDTTARWHIHPNSEECFLVLSGDLILDIEEQVIIIKPGEFYAVPSGKKHRARAEELVRVVVIDAFRSDKDTQTISPADETF